jgi:hypothetical protein
VCATDVPLPTGDRLPECRLPGGDVADPGLLDLMLGGLVR